MPRGLTTMSPRPRRGPRYARRAGRRSPSAQRPALPPSTVLTSGASRSSRPSAVRGIDRDLGAAALDEGAAPPLLRWRKQAPSSASRGHPVLVPCERLGGRRRRYCFEGMSSTLTSPWRPPESCCFDRGVAVQRRCRMATAAIPRQTAVGSLRSWRECFLTALCGRLACSCCLAWSAARKCGQVRRSRCGQSRACLSSFFARCASAMRASSSSTLRSARRFQVRRRRLFAVSS
jgi:hypothetical protein